MIDALASISAEPDRLTRLYLTPEHKRAAHLVGDWMRRAGLDGPDGCGRHHARPARRRAGRGAPRKRLLIGSHIDTVIDAGRYDGNLGVVAGILAVEEIRARGIALPFDLEILAFGDEEGVRFPKTLFGSSTVAGRSSSRRCSTSSTPTGVKIGDALLAFGGDPDALAAEAYRRADVARLPRGPYRAGAGARAAPASRSAWSPPSPARAATA